MAARLPAWRGNPRASCTECRRRKKKCDRSQPCRNCARRYPPVDCLYDQEELLSREGVELILQWPDKVLGHRTSPVSSKDAYPTETNIVENVSNSDNLSLSRHSSRSADGTASVKGEDEAVSVGHGDSPPYARHLVRRTSKQNEFGQFISCGTLNLLRMLSIEGTSSNAMFFYTHSKVLTRFDYSVDGFGEPPEIYINVWRPFTIHSPVILHLNLLRAAIVQSHVQPDETNFEKTFLYHSPERLPVDKAAILRLRVRALSMLNTRLRSLKYSADDENIGSVLYLIYLEWVWNDDGYFTGLMHHVKGLHEMLKMRGGLLKLGQSGYMRKLVMLCHYHLAVMLECEGFVCPTEFLQDKFLPDHHPLQRYECPLWIVGTRFMDKVDDRILNRATAQMLDAMSFLIGQIRSCILDNTLETEYSQIMAAVTQINIKISTLPSANEAGHFLSDDFVYEVVRITSLTYCKAILRHITLSRAWVSKDVDAILEATSHVPLQVWKDIPGVWLYILLITISGTRFRREGQLSRALFRICSFSIGIRDWQTFVNILESFLAVQKWIMVYGPQNAVILG